MAQYKVKRKGENIMENYNDYSSLDERDIRELDNYSCMWQSVIENNQYLALDIGSYANSLCDYFNSKKVTLKEQQFYFELFEFDPDKANYYNNKNLKEYLENYQKTCSDFYDEIDGEYSRSRFLFIYTSVTEDGHNINYGEWRDLILNDKDNLIKYLKDFQRKCEGYYNGRIESIIMQRNEISELSILEDIDEQLKNIEKKINELEPEKKEITEIEKSRIKEIIYYEIVGKI